MAEELWKIPTSWEWTTLNRLGDIVGGGTPSTKQPRYWGDGINWISPSDLTGYKSKTIARGAKSITQAGLANSGASVMPRGSVHFSSRAPIGYVVISAAPLATNQGFKSLVPSEGIFNEFVYYYLKSATGMARARASGTTFLELSGAAFGVLPIPIAPTGEQRRVVAKIEELFSELDNGMEALKTAHEQLKAYRQSVLKHAFDGRWTTDCRATHTAWRDTCLGDEIEYLTSGSRGWAEYYADSGDTFIRAQNLKYDRLDLTDIAFVTLPDGNTEGLRTRVKVGDVLITITGANVTKTGIVKSELGAAYVSQHVALCRPAPSIMPMFLYRYLLSEAHGRGQLNEAAYGAGKPGLNLDNIRSVTLSLPSLKEQAIIVERIEAALSVEQELLGNIDDELQRTNALRQSILKKAFSGQLVPQDAKDEPVSVLLERIRAARDGASAKQSRNGKSGQRQNSQKNGKKNAA